MVYKCSVTWREGIQCLKGEWMQKLQSACYTIGTACYACMYFMIGAYEKKSTVPYRTVPITWRHGLSVGCCFRQGKGTAAGRKTTSQSRRQQTPVLPYYDFASRRLPMEDAMSFFLQQ